MDPIDDLMAQRTPQPRRVATRAPLSVVLFLSGAVLLATGALAFVAGADRVGFYAFGCGILGFSLGAFARWHWNPEVPVMPAPPEHPRRAALPSVVVLAFVGWSMLRRGEPAGGIVIFAGALLVVAVLVDALRKADRAL